MKNSKNWIVNAIEMNDWFNKDRKVQKTSSNWGVLDLVVVAATVFMVLGNIFDVIDVSWFIALAPIGLPIVIGFVSGLIFAIAKRK